MDVVVKIAVERAVFVLPFFCQRDADGERVALPQVIVAAWRGNDQMPDLAALAVRVDVDIQVNEVFAVQLFDPRAVFAVVEGNGDETLFFEEFARVV